MHIRPAQAADLDRVADIDATVESTQYLHLERQGEGLCVGWRLEPRPLRAKLIESNAPSDDLKFMLKQIVTGADEGLALVAEHERLPVALALARPRPEHGTLQLLDLRVDYDLRRQGIATVLVYQIVQAARDQHLRAVFAETRANNQPAYQMLQKLGFDMAGIDTQRLSNHDVVKESATLLWYTALD